MKLKIILDIYLNAIDKNMIEHYERIIHEIEEGIDAIGNEINSSWNR